MTRPELDRYPAADRAPNLANLAAQTYAEMRDLARHVLRRRGGDASPRTTSLVHETYLRLAGTEPEVRDERHLLAIAARAMRFILVDRARRSGAVKRGGENPAPLPSSDSGPAASVPSADLIALDEALRRLAAVDPRKADVVDLRFFGGLGVDETATVLGVSRATVKRDFLLARAWLFRELSNAR